MKHKISVTSILFASVALFLTACAATQNDKLLYEELLKLAEKGNPVAQYAVGMMLNNGLGTDRDPKKAFTWFDKADSGGDPLGSYKLGCYYGGQFKVVKVDKAKELKHKLIAAKAGYSLAQYDVGLIYYKKSNYAEAKKWWLKSAKQGYPPSLVYLSEMYKEGKGVAPSKTMEYAYLKIAKLAVERKMSAAQKLANYSAYGDAHPKAKKILDEMKKNMKQKKIDSAENIAKEWSFTASSLTERAGAGIEDARTLVKMQTNK